MQYEICTDGHCLSVRNMHKQCPSYIFRMTDIVCQYEICMHKHCLCVFIFRTDGHCLCSTTMYDGHCLSVRNMYVGHCFRTHKQCPTDIISCTKYVTDIVCAVRNMYDGHCLSVRNMYDGHCLCSTYV